MSDLPGEMTTHRRVAPPSITKIGRTLVDRGLVVRVPDPDDGRVTRVAVTPAGPTLLDAVRQRKDLWFAARLAELAAAIGDADRAISNLTRAAGAGDPTIVAVANDPQGQEVVKPFAEAHNLPFPILLDEKNSLVTQLGLPGIPTSYLLDQQGRIVLYEVGQRNWNHPDMHRLLDVLLADAKAS